MRYWQRKRQNDIMCLPFNMNLYRHKRGISSQQMTDRHGTVLSIRKRNKTGVWLGQGDWWQRQIFLLCFKYVVILVPYQIICVAYII